jgi:hypothetical protein
LGTQARAGREEEGEEEERMEEEEEEEEDKGEEKFEWRGERRELEGELHLGSVGRCVLAG